MTNETVIAILVSVCTLAFSIFSGVSGIRRGYKHDQRRDASELTMVIVKLEDISAGISEIKADMSCVKGDIKELTARLIVAEQQLKLAKGRIDELQRAVGQLHG